MLKQDKMVVNHSSYGRNWLLIMLRIYSRLWIIRLKELSLKNKTKLVVNTEVAIHQSPRKLNVPAAIKLQQLPPIIWEAVLEVINVRELGLTSAMSVQLAILASLIIPEVQKDVLARVRILLSKDQLLLSILCNSNNNP